MNPSEKELTDRVTVLVFKDNYAARTFQVPLRWITRFGVLLGAGLAILLVITVLFLKYYRISRHAPVGRVQDLEQELADTKAALAAAKQGAAQPELPPVAAPPAASPPAEVSTPLPAAVAPVPAGAFGFSAFGPQIQPANPGQVPISAQGFKVFWQGRALHVNFNIQYRGGDQGNQQGRIIVLARGPESLLGYPDGVFHLGGNEVLINPDQGEYFSVSRFREVKARFAAGRGAESVKEVEIFLISDAGQLLIFQRMPVPAPPAAPAVTAPPRAPEPAPQAPESSQ